MLTFLRLLILLLFFLVCTSSCTEKKAIVNEKAMVMSEQSPSKASIKQSWQQVSVTFLNFEGGFYGLVTEKGAKLLPINLPAKYKIDGTILRIKGQPIKNMITIQQWGEPFELSEIELVKLGEGKLPTH